jgi:hypothetical protein
LTRLVTVLVYVLLALLSLGLELEARRSRRFATLEHVLTLALRRWPVRLLLQAGWLWVGWHLFVRVEWR